MDMPKRHIIESFRERRNVYIAKRPNHFADAIVNGTFRKRYIFNICKFRYRFTSIVFAT